MIIKLNLKKDIRNFKHQIENNNLYYLNKLYYKFKMVNENFYIFIVQGGRDMNSFMNSIGDILYSDILFLERSVEKFYVGVILYFVIYLFLYIFISKTLKINKIIKILFFSWIIIRPLILLYLIFITISR